MVRLSGAQVAAIRDAICAPRASGAWIDGRQRRVDVRDARGVFDDGVAIFAAGPRTYTGEDTLEVTVHGNPLVTERLVAAAIANGARLATGGEFTRRAVLAGKLDLLAAEGVDQLIRAKTPAGVQVAREAVRGTLSETLQATRSVLIDATAELEARLDYPADELALETDSALIAGLQRAASHWEQLAATAEVGRRLVDGARVVLVGPVNAGKSSLLNALVGHRRALVHDRPGTTRDVVEARTLLPLEDGGTLEITLLDTAGERPDDPTPNGTLDPVESAGIALGRSVVQDADLLVVVLRERGDDPVEQAVLERTAGRSRVIVANHADRHPTRDTTVEIAGPDGAFTVLCTSATTGQGLSELKAAIASALVGSGLPEGAAIASLRQADQLRQAAESARSAIDALPIAGVAVAADLLVEGLEALDALTGADTREDVLDAVFARFCIGK